MVRAPKPTVILVLLCLFCGAFMVIGCGGGGGSDGGGDVCEVQDAAPVSSMENHETIYQENIKTLAGDTSEFYVERGLQPYQLGMFLNKEMLAYKPGYDINYETKLFADRIFEFRSKVTDQVSYSPGGLKLFNIVDITLGESKSISTASTMQYEFALENITLKYISAPGEFMMAEGDNAPTSDKVIYGEYTADVLFHAKILQENSCKVAMDNDVLYGIVNIAETENWRHVEWGDELRLQKVGATIGFLIRDKVRIGSITRF